MNDNSDPQYQQQQLEQLKFETSQISIDPSIEKSWFEQGINEYIVQKIRLCVADGKLASNDIDNRICEQLRSLCDDMTGVDSLFDEFNNSDLTGVVNKNAFFLNVIKQWKIQNPQQQKTTNNNSKFTQGSADTSGKHKPGPDETKLKQILDRTGYNLEITAGQRKYGGPPPDGPERPAPSSEVFIGKLPREIFEDELIPLCEEAGKIWDLRLMIDPTSGFNKGYCFVTFCSQQDSMKACEKLNGYAIRPGKLIKANGSVANVRLFIGNIPKTKSKEEIHEELTKVVEGVTNIITYTPTEEADKKKNRGFCFVDFDTHKNASVAKRKLSNSRVRLFNRDIAVDWADPDEEPDDATMSQVKVLYVRNITSDVSENDVKDVFLPYGNIERVRKVRDYAFVHFDKREDALNAMRALNGKNLGKNIMDISLAKPLSDKRKQAQSKREQRKQFDSTPFQPRSGGSSSSSSSIGFGNNFQRSNQGNQMNRSDNSSNTFNFGAFGGENSVGSSNQNNRGGRGRGGFGNNNRGNISRPHSGNLNTNNRGGFNNNNNNFRGGFNGQSQNNNSSNFNYQGGFGAFNGPTQNNNNNSQFNRFGINSVQQQYGGMKRGSNQINDGNLAKRNRIDTGSWGSMGGENNSNNNNTNSQQTNSSGNWYQDQSYNNLQQQSNYSWN